MSSIARGVRSWVSRRRLVALAAGSTVLVVVMLVFASLAFGTGSAPFFVGAGPSVGAAVQTLTPTLSAQAYDPDPADTVSFRFQVSTTADFSVIASDSGWLAAMASPWKQSWVVGTGSTPLPEPASGTQLYYWRALARDDATDNDGSAGHECVYSNPGVNDCVATTWWNGGVIPRSFVLTRMLFGTGDAWPLLSAAGATVNEATGNLVLAAPAPEFPSAATSLGLSVSFNSQDSNDRGFGVGWSIGVGPGGSMPVKLIDPTAPNGLPGLVQALLEDGSSIWFVQPPMLPIPLPVTYQPTDGSSSELDQNADGTWTLRSGDGEVYSYPIGSNGVHDLDSAIVPIGNRAIADPTAQSLTYSFFGGTSRVSKLTDGVRSLELNWACASAIVCVTQHTGLTGGDTTGVEYRYIGTSITTGRLAEVHRVQNGRDRTLVRYTYTGSNLTSIKNADDINSPNLAAVPLSPGYNAAHEVQLGYDAQTPARVTRIEEVGITGQSGSTSRKWTLSYSATGTVSAPINHPSAGRVAAGSTSVCLPRQQPACAALASVVFDGYARPLETIDARPSPSRTTRVQYDDAGRLIWSEDTVGASTDNTWDTSRNWLLQKTGPDPDATGPLPRPVTTYRYDEKTPGTATTAGLALAGLQAEYFKNQFLQGTPASISSQEGDPVGPWTEAGLTDGGYSLSWGAGAPAQIPGQTDHFSARYSGYINLNRKRTSGGNEIPASWKFAVASDDGMRLYVDGALVIDRWNISGCTSTTPCVINIALTSGNHRIVADYQENMGDAGVRFAFGCLDCDAGTLNTDSLFQPGWGNQTSTVAPSGRYAYSHFTEPQRGLADYTLVRAPISGLSGNQPIISRFSYDNLGRVTKRWMPKGVFNAATGSGCTIDSASGTLSCPTGFPDDTYAKQYDYYATSDTVASAACGTTSVVQAGLLKQTKDNPTSSGISVVATTVVYDAAGRVIATTKGAGTTCTTYDDEGVVATEQAPGETSTTRRVFTHDPVGDVRQVAGVNRLCPPPHSSCTGSSSTITLEYDESGRVIKSTGASAGNQSSFVYDADGNTVSRRDYPATFSNTNTLYTTGYIYDSADQLTQLTDANSKIFRFGYDKRGALTWTQYPNTTFDWSMSDFSGRETARYARACPGTLANCPTDLANQLTGASGQNNSAIATPPATSAIVDYTQSFDTDNRVTQTIRSGAGGLSTQTTGYIYDDAGRLSQAALTSTITSENKTWAYTYDADSNRANETAGGTTTTYTYDPTKTPGLDQLSQTTSGSTTKCFAYDSDQRETLKGTWNTGATLCTGTGLTTNERSGFWDGRNRHYDGQYAGTFVGRSFDPLDRELERHVNSTSTHTRFYSYAGTSDAPVFETDTNGVIKQSYIPGAPLRYTCDYLVDSACSARPTTGTAEYLYNNPHGDLAATADAAGARTSALTYEPFGKPRQTPPTNQANLSRDLWLGADHRRYDNNSGLVEMGARPYDPTIGRFLAVDPRDAGSCNAYDYVCQDPINDSDPDGLGPGPCPSASETGKRHCGGRPKVTAVWRGPGGFGSAHGIPKKVVEGAIHKQKPGHASGSVDDRNPDVEIDINTGDWRVKGSDDVQGNVWDDIPQRYQPKKDEHRESSGCGWTTPWNCRIDIPHIPPPEWPSLPGPVGPMPLPMPVP